MSYYPPEEEDWHGDDADRIRSRARDGQQTHKQTQDDVHGWQVEGHYDAEDGMAANAAQAQIFQDLKKRIAQGQSIEQLLRAGFSEAQLRAVGMLNHTKHSDRRRRGATTFNADRVIGETDIEGAFSGDAATFSRYSGDPMADPGLQKKIEMQPAFGMANTVNNMLNPDPKFAPQPEVAQQFAQLNDYQLSPSTPMPGMGPSYSPFASIHSGPRPTAPASGGSSGRDSDAA